MTYKQKPSDVKKKKKKKGKKGTENPRTVAQPETVWCSVTGHLKDNLQCHLKDNRDWKKFEEMMTNIVSNLTKTINPRIQEALQIPSIRNMKNNTSRNSIIKLLQGREKRHPNTNQTKQTQWAQRKQGKDVPHFPPKPWDSQLST